MSGIAVSMQGPPGIDAFTILFQDGIISAPTSAAFVAWLDLRTSADAAATDADVASTHADVVLTHADVVLTGADVASTHADVALTHADVVSIQGDVASTHADAASTHADAAATAADVLLTHADVVSSNADAASTHADAVSTHADVVSTHADVASTHADVLLTHADVVSTASNRDAGAASAATAAGGATQAGAARDQALAARDYVAAIANTGVGLVFPTWAALSTIVAPANTGAIVIDADTSSHTDPVTATTVPNAGIYRYAGSGWQHVADSSAVTLLAIADALTAIQEQEGELSGVHGFTPGPIAGSVPDVVAYDKDGNARFALAADQSPIIPDRYGNWWRASAAAPFVVGAETSTALTVGATRDATFVVGAMPALAPGVTRGLAAGLIDPDHLDSAAVTIGVDTSGAIVDAACEGSPWRQVGYVAAAGGLIRCEAVAMEPDATFAPTVTTVSIPAGRRRLRGQRWQYRLGSSVPSPAPALVAVANEAFTLRLSGETFLAYQFVRGTIVVKRASDGTVLTLGTDYTLDPDRGAMQAVAGGAAASADLACTVSYSGAPQRVDIVSYNPATGAYTATQGVAHPRQPGMWQPLYPDRFFTPDPSTVTLPAIPAGDIVTHRLFRWPDGVTRQNVAQFRKGGWVERPEDLETYVAEMRRRLGSFRHALETAPLAVYIGYGDSITAYGGGYGTPATLNTTANGDRDTIGYLANFDAATRAMIPVFDLGDAYGKTHTREGYHWRLVKALAARFGRNYDSAAGAVTLRYDNRGIGGTNAHNDSQNGYLNGSHPDRLNALIASVTGGNAAPALGGVAFGMNDLASNTFYADLVNIGSQLLAAGITPLFWMPVRRNALYGGDTTEQWLARCDELRRAADDLDCAYVDATILFADDVLANGGLTSREFSAATDENHPGLIDPIMLARLAAKFF